MSVTSRLETELLSASKRVKEEPKRQKQWILRYKYGNHPAQGGTILARTRENAERVGRTWCLRKASGKMHIVRFIGIEDPILADESILGEDEA